MYCQNCGRKIDDTAKFCPYCGSEQKRAPGQENQSGNNVEGKNPWPRGVFIGLAVIAIVVVGLFAVCAALDGDDMPVATEPRESQIETTPPTEAPVPTTETQIPEDGWKTVDGKRYYYQDGEKYVGVQEIDGALYYFDKNGVMAVGQNVRYGSTTFHTSSDGSIEAFTFSVMYGDWAEESYRFGNGGSSSVLEFSSEIMNCDSFRFCLEASGMYGAKVNGTWKIYIRHNGQWKFVQDIDYTQPKGYFDIKLDEPKTFDAITAHPTVEGNASYTSSFYLQNVHCVIPY